MAGISIIDYGMANLRSVQKGFEQVGAAAQIIGRPDEIDAADKLVLPGVGAFQDAVATLLATNGITQPSGPQTYGALAVHGPSVSRPFSFTASGTNGQTIRATLQLQDGAINRGLAGLVINGSIRDSDALRRLGFPVKVCGAWLSTRPTPRSFMQLQARWEQ